MGKTVWGYWNCKFCGSSKIRGDNEECPFCGHPRSEDTKFYMDETKIEYVSDEQVNRKVNWICPYCNTQNEDYEETCEYCGASKTESYGNYFEVQETLSKTPEKVQVIEESKEEDVCESSNRSRAYENSDDPFVQKRRWDVAKLKKGLMYGAIGIAVVSLITLLVWFFTPAKHDSEVSGFEWNRNISIELLTTFEESDWSLPAGARLQYTNEEIRSYKPVIDHYDTVTTQVERERYVGEEEYVSGYEDLGNGQFEEIISKRPVYETYYETEVYEKPVYRDEPVYDTKYYYEIDRYVYERSVKTSGSDHNPYWGEINLKHKEREGDRKENYWLICGEYRTTISLNEWQAYEIGDKVVVTTNRTGDIVYSIERS